MESDQMVGDIELKKYEYSQTLTSYRHYSNIRFAILTLFISSNAGLIAMLGVLDKIEFTPVLTLAGLLSSIVFFIYHEVIVNTQDSFHTRWLFRSDGATRFGQMVPL